ncbi:MAG: hypothetical protein DI555_00930 [Novosphingobium pentaromativorans]|uniref:Fimbrial protein n=1 Tax=Novosphingobium pentaromativorans TaxID=205844 RepID=A0A2W5QIC6_9SPHN|nr:MAG: hypothetical protein DI555_00930 [Novosphingobium pentaromativorans]
MVRAYLIVAVGSMAMAGGVAEPAKAEAPRRAGTAPPIKVSAPPGFEDLTGPQQVVLDVYMGGVRIGEAAAVVRPGHFRFVDAQALVESLPDISDRPRLTAALGAPDLDPHPEAVCLGEGQDSCPRPKPDVVAIVYDPARYRVDILVAPRFLTLKAAVRMQNLPPPAETPALINFLTGTISGSRGEPTQYFVQDTALIGIGTGRIRGTFQQASYSGFQTDTLAGELDRPGLRYRAGAFWIPGNVLLDRVKMVGMGLSTQFSTRLDRDQLTGSPLIVFLEQRARVDILVNGNIMSSLMYEAGNQALDTSALPDGSYTVILRIIPAAGAAREEQRFFSRSATLPMAGHDSFFLYAGALVRNNQGLIGDVTNTPLFQGSWARRISTGLAVNLGLIGTDTRQWASAGATVLKGDWQLDGSVHVSNKGGLGIYGHLSRSGTGRLTFDLDGRRVSNPGGGPLFATTEIVLPASGGLEYRPYSGGYTQLSGAIGYRIGEGRLSLVGTYRRQEGSRDYSVGPALYMPVVRWRRAMLDLNATYTKTSLGTQAYVGLSLIVTRPRTTYTATGAGQFGPGRGFEDGLQGGINVSRRFDDVSGAQVQADGGVQHANGITYAQAQLQARSDVGGGNVNFVQPFDSGDFQYGASLNTALVVGQGGLRFNEGRNGDAMIVVHVDSAIPDAAFEVLVDNRPMGMANGGEDLTVTLPSYRAYDVRVRARGGALSDYDAKSRQVTLYPGSVVRLAWNARPVTAVFGRLVQPGGAPIAKADISAGGDLAQSDERGNFLIQTSRGATLVVRMRGGSVCKVGLDAIQPIDGYAAVGDLLCQPTIASADDPSQQPQTEVNP